MSDGSAAPAVEVEASAAPVEEVANGEKQFKIETVDAPTMSRVASPAPKSMKKLKLDGEHEDEDTEAVLVPTVVSEEDAKLLGGTDPELVDIIQGNRRFIAETTAKDPTFFQRQARHQNPKYFYIGCCDARVDPNMLLGLPPGSLFVHRNIGNLVCPADMNLHSALEYAVQVLKVQHILIVGHYDCGAVRGTTKAVTIHLPALVEYWIRNIRDVSRHHAEELASIDDDEKRHRRLVELNVTEQCLNIFKVGAVQRRRQECLDRGERFLLPRIHGCVFDPADGVLVKLNLGWRYHSRTVQQIYEIVDPNRKGLDKEKLWFGDQLKAPATSP